MRSVKTSHDINRSNKEVIMFKVGDKVIAKKSGNIYKILSKTNRCYNVEIIKHNRSVVGSKTSFSISSVENDCILDTTEQQHPTPPVVWKTVEGPKFKAGDEIEGLVTHQRFKITEVDNICYTIKGMRFKFNQIDDDYQLVNKVKAQPVVNCNCNHVNTKVVAMVTTAYRLCTDCGADLGDADIREAR